MKNNIDNKLLQYQNGRQKIIVEQKKRKMAKLFII